MTGESAKTTARGKRGEFFAVGRDSFVAATGLGLLPALTFLVMASGSQKDNKTTSWSAEGARKRLGVNWQSAGAAIAQLMDAGLVTMTNADKVVRTPRTPPTYHLAKDGQPIWLPRSLVDGAGAETPPIQLIRQTHDVLLLRLLVDLYAHHNLPEYEGLSTDLIYATYGERAHVKEYGEHGGWSVWQFDDSTSWVSLGADCDALVQPHRINPKRLTAAAKAEWKRLRPGREIDATTAFWHRYHLLRSWKLIEIVPYLFDGPLPDGAPLLPFHPGSPIALERELARAAQAKAEECLADWQLARLAERGTGGPVVPIPLHITNVTMIGIVRLHYRPHTTMTAGWLANRQANLESWIERFGGDISGDAAA